MRYEPDYKAKTREKVLGEAARTMRVEGVQGMGVAAVMAKAGLTHGAFYAHFASKDELIDETIKAMILEARGRFEAVTEGLAPADALRAYVTFYLSTRHRDNTASSCPLPWVATEVPRLGAPSRKRYGAAVAGLSELVATKLRALDRPHADANADTDALSLASSIVAELIGALSLARAVAEKSQSDAILARSRAGILARLGLDPG